MKLDHFLIPYAKINSTWIQDLNVIPETIKLLKENIGSDRLDISLRNIFMGMSPQAREIKTEISYQDYTKTKRFCTAEMQQSTKQKKSYLLNERRYLQMIYLIRG